MMSAQFEFVIMNVQSECQCNGTITGTNILHVSPAKLAIKNRLLTCGYSFFL